MLELCMKLYIGVYDTSIVKTVYVLKRTYCTHAEQQNCLTEIQEEQKNVKYRKLSKRSFNQTNEGVTRPNNTTIPQHTTHARVSSNN